MKNNIHTQRGTWVSIRILAASFLALQICPAQDSATVPPNNGPLPKSAPLAQIEARWSKASSDDLRAAAITGVADAQFYFGKIEIDAASKDNSRASQWGLKASGPNLIVFTEKQSAEFKLKWKDAKEADVRAAANAGDQSAQYCMVGLESDKARARGQQGLEWIKRAAQQSLIVAEETVANYYLGLTTWILVTPDEKEGTKWLESAASHGSELAQHKFADFLLTGRHASPDVPKGLEWLRKAVDLKCPRAAYELGMLYANGNGEPRDATETPVELFRRAGVAGNNLGMAALADRYRTGLGVERDYIRAIRIYQSASQADGGMAYDKSSHAETILDVLDDKGEPKPLTNPDINRFAQVYSLYYKAVNRRDAVSVNEIGQLYLRGVNVPKSPVEACKWFSLAAARGNADAVRERDKLKASFSAEDLQKAAQPLPEFKSSP